jgi:hypothetical protein
MLPVAVTVAVSVTVMPVPAVVSEEVRVVMDVTGVGKMSRVASMLALAGTVSESLTT